MLNVTDCRLVWFGLVDSEMVFDCSGIHCIPQASLDL